MEQVQQPQLSPDDKKLFNILEIKIYDISQNVEILSRQLTPNQIKEIVAHTFSIFNQLKYFFQKSKVHYLYNLMRKMQINAVIMTSILTDRLEKQSNEPITTKTLSNKDNTKQNSEEVQFESQLQLKQKVLCKKIRQLGGIYLYNEHYTRGLEYQDFKEVFPSGQDNQHKGKLFKRYREQFLTTIMKEIDNKAEVEVEGINDQVKNYILNYKENTKMANFISCQKELSEIIDFFKLSELQALNFLNKSPKHNEYTQDYINRLNQMERDIKVKEKSQKVGILEKMKLFIEKLKEKMVEIERKYEEKNAKLIQYEKSLKKETVSQGTQTYDNFERRIKEMEGKLREEQQKYNILNSMRMAEHNMQDQVHHLNNQIQVKNNQLKKLQQTHNELQDELQHFKKIIRESKQKLALISQPQKRKIKNKNGKDLTAKIDETALQKIQSKPEEDLAQQTRQSRSSELRQYKKSRRLEKLGTYIGYRSSFQTNNLDAAQKKNEEMRMRTEQESLTRLQNKERLTENREKFAESRCSPIDITKNSQRVESNATSLQVSPDPSSRQIKESIFKQQHKKNTVLRKIDEQSKVSFNMPKTSQLVLTEAEQKFAIPTSKLDQCTIKQRSLQQSHEKSKISIEGDKFQQEQDITRRSQRKNTLRQKLDRSICSIKSIKDIDCFQSKKDSKSVSKKCIILKDKKQKNIITTSIKLTNMAIVHQFDLFINQQSQAKKEVSIYQKVRFERPSYPVSLAKGSSIIQQNFKANLMRSKTKIGGVQLKKKQKVNSKDIPGLQPIKSNKSLGPMFLPHKRANREDQSIGVTREVSKEKRNSINNSTQALSLLQKGQLTPQDREFISNLLKKIQNQKSNLQLERIHSNAYNSKQLKTGPKKINGVVESGKNQRLSKGIEKWIFENSVDLQGNSLVNYIRSQLECQRLSMDEFKEIMMTLDSSPDLAYSHLTKKGLFFNETQKTLQHQLLRQQESTDYRVRKEMKIGQQKNNPKALDFFTLDGVQLVKLKEIHQKYSQCAGLNKQNHLCQHLEKYLGIIRRISELQTKCKLPYKLPIEKIGENENPTEKTSKYHKTLQDSGQAYIKSHVVTDHNYEQDKPRILPIISSTTSAYYKPKSKLVR